MSEVILFVFEGKKTEETALRSFKNYYLRDGKSTLIHATYNTSIYSLYKQLKNDQFLDLVEVLRDRDKDNKERLDGISRDDISEIYLFFDYDGHVSNADDGKLRDMLGFYNNETENGQLFVSYPMVESLKHVHEQVDFSKTQVQAKMDINYKGLVASNGCANYRDMTALTWEQWKYLLSEHCKKANLVVNDAFELPNSQLLQNEIFEAQLEKFITPSAMVCVLSAFPLLILHYYGVEKLSEMV